MRYRMSRLYRPNKKNNMKQIALITLSTILLLSCGNNNNSDSLDREVTMVEQNQGMGNYQGKHIIVFKNNSISFLGKTIVIDDSTHIMQQIKDVVAGDENLSIEGNVLTIGDVGFGINLRYDGVFLISSTQVDDPKIKPVVKYLNSIYDTAKEDEPDNFWWCAGGPNDFVCEKTIRLRPLHSEEGGTVILFY